MKLVSRHGKTIDLVHFNSGYRDMTITPYFGEPMMSLEEYTCALRKIIKLSRAVGAKIIFNAAREVMAEENVPINDLYAVCKAHERYYKCEDNLHHTSEGNEVLAQHIADAILKKLGMV